MKKYCRKGHPLDKFNARIIGRWTICRECKRIACRAYYRKNNPKKLPGLKNPRDSRGWIIPRTGTKGRKIYDAMCAGASPVELTSMFGRSAAHYSWRIKNPLKVINAKRKANGGQPRIESEEYVEI